MTDQELATMAAANNRGAWLVLTTRYRAMVSAVMHRYAPSEAFMFDDYAQDVWTHIARHIGRFDPARGNLDSWIYTLARSAVCAVYRQHVAARKRECGLDYDFAAPDIDLDDMLDNARESAELKARINALSRCMRDVIMLKCAGNTNGQIGRRMRRSREWVRTVVNEAESILTCKTRMIVQLELWPDTPSNEDAYAAKHAG